MLIDVAIGINYLHTNGYYHGDIAARNAFIGDGYKAKLGDFGLTLLRKSNDEEYAKLSADSKIPILVINKFNFLIFHVF